MAKVEEDPAAEVKRLKKLRRKQLAQRKVETSASGDVDYIESKPKFDLEGRMDQALTNKEAVIVKQGQYSGTVNTIKRASLPVNISPVQLNALYNNTEMDEKLRRSEVKEKALALNEKTYSLKPVDQEAPAEGVYIEKTGEFAPRSGGVLDINSGLYVPPEKDATYNGALKVYVPTDASGRIDKDTGQYVAPKGLKLDPRAGFTATKSGKKDQVLLAQAAVLNDATKPLLWSGGEKATTEGVAFKNWSETDKIAKDIVEIELYGYGGSIDSTNETGGTS